jgi:hypothetical protein
LLPLIPEVPEDPAVPLIPSIPDVPLVPCDPLIPDVPFCPLVPELPEEPLVPEDPGVSASSNFSIANVKQSPVFTPDWGKLGPSYITRFDSTGQQLLQSELLSFKGNAF